MSKSRAGVLGTVFMWSVAAAAGIGIIDAVDNKRDHEHNDIPRDAAIAIAVAGTVAYNVKRESLALSKGETAEMKREP